MAFKFIRLQNTDGIEVIINTEHILKITDMPETNSTPKRTMIELIADTNVNIFTYISIDIIFDKLAKCYGVRTKRDGSFFQFNLTEGEN